MLQYRTIFETLLPDGELWKPKYIETLYEPEEHIVNGTFDTNLSGWTYDVNVTWVSGAMNFNLPGS